MRIKEILALLEEHFPTALAESWDNVGLLIGDGEAAVEKELLAVERALTALAARGLRQLPGVEVFTGPGQSGVLSFRCRDLDCEEAAARLAEAGIAVRAGLHCAPMAHRSGGTLETGTVRVSFSAFNTSAEVRQFLQVCRTAFLPG